MVEQIDARGTRGRVVHQDERHVLAVVRKLHQQSQRLGWIGQALHPVVLGVPSDELSLDVCKSSPVLVNGEQKRAAHWSKMYRTTPLNRTHVETYLARTRGRTKLDGPSDGAGHWP